ncbi:MAG: VTT domain-containing protein [bacterium]
MTKWFKLGIDCMCMSPAKTAAILIDGETYFRTVREAMKHARQQIIIVGWDIHSKVKLLRGQHEDDGWPVELGEFLSELSQRKPEITIYILSWDFAVIYLFEREIFPVYRFNWNTGDNLHFKADSTHPPGASQHQKIVVIDDFTAFCGGFDLTISRWDTRKHKVDDKRKRNPLNKSYNPFHDIQMAVQGEVAAVLGKIARERWLRASGKKIPPVRDQQRHSDFSLQAEHIFTNVDVAVARTFPCYADYPKINEVEQLYISSMRKAQNFIYLENQYITSEKIGGILENKLQEQDGPDIIIITPGENSGWLEKDTMGVLRVRLLRKLRKSDRYNRLRVCYPVTGDNRDVPINIHAKLTIIDDDFLRIGSANLSNRSMGFDSECDLAFSAKNNEQHTQITSVRHDLIAEHTGFSVSSIKSAEKKSDCLGILFDHLISKSDKLKTLNEDIDDLLDSVVPDDKFIDPERPVSADELVKGLLPDISVPDSSKIKPALVLAAWLLPLLALAVLWRTTSLGNYVSPEYLFSVLEPIRQSSLAPAISVLLFIILGFLMVPVTVLIVLNSLLLGGWTGFFTALTGGVTAAAVHYVVGRFLWRDTIRKLAGRKLNTLTEKLQKPGIFALTAVRLMPVAPFTMINIVAGTMRVRFWQYILGTILGMLPGIIGISFFSDRVYEILKDPSPKSIAIGAGTVAILAAGVFLLRMVIIRKNEIKAKNQEREHEDNRHDI